MSSSASRTLQGSFGEDPQLQVWAQAALREHLHVSAEKPLEILLERDHIEQCSTRLDIDEKSMSLA